MALSVDRRPMISMTDELSMLHDQKRNLSPQWENHAGLGKFAGRKLMHNRSPALNGTRSQRLQYALLLLHGLVLHGSLWCVRITCDVREREL